MRAQRAVLLLVSVFAGLLFHRPAWAALVIVLVSPEPPGEAYEPYLIRLRSELTAAGFLVRPEQGKAEISALSLAQLAERSGGQAALSVILRSGTVRGSVWLRDARSERSISRDIPPESVSPEGPAIFAIRATDLLHGALLELGYPRPEPAPRAAPHAASPASLPPASSAPPPSAAAPKAPPTPLPTARAPSRRAPTALPAPSPRNRLPLTFPWEIRASGAVIGGPGGSAPALPIMVAPSLAVLRAASAHWATGIRLMAAFGGGIQRRQNPGNARVDQELALAVLAGRWGLGQQGLGRRVRGSVELGGGLHRLGAQGEVPANDASRRGHSVSGTTACLFAGLDLTLAVSQRISGHLGFGSAFPLGRTEITFSDRVVAASALPLFIGSLGLGWHL